MPESAAALDNCVARSFRSAEDLDVHAYYWCIHVVDPRTQSRSCPVVSADSFMLLVRTWYVHGSAETYTLWSRRRHHLNLCSFCPRDSRRRPHSRRIDRQRPWDGRVQPAPAGSVATRRMQMIARAMENGEKPYWGTPPSPSANGRPPLSAAGFTRRRKEF
jgi:hypothetical protein